MAKFFKKAHDLGLKVMLDFPLNHSSPISLDLPLDPKKDAEYFLEYGKDTVEIHKDAIQQNQNVVLIDDLLATGGTALASCKLIEKLRGKIVECAFIIELPELKGREKISQCPVFSIVKFEGE